MLQSLNGMGVEAKQIKKGAALSRGETKSAFLSFRCPHSPPSEIRLAWSELTAAHSNWGLLLCPWTLWTSRLFAVLKTRQSHIIKEDEKIRWKALGNAVPSSSAKLLSIFHQSSTKTDRSLRQVSFRKGDMCITLNTGLSDIGPAQ